MHNRDIIKPLDGCSELQIQVKLTIIINTRCTEAFCMMYVSQLSVHIN